MNTFLLYDPALNGAYTQYILQQQYPTHVSLFAGTKDESLDDVAPILFQIDNSFADKVLTKPLIELAAVTLWFSDLKLENLANHLRQFIYQKIKGREYYFRLWDARVMRKFLPTCSKEQIRTIFEGVDALGIVDEQDPAMLLQYRQDHGRQSRSTIPLEDVYGKESQTPAGPPQPASAKPVDQPPSATQQAGPPQRKKGRSFLL